MKAISIKGIIYSMIVVAVCCGYHATAQTKKAKSTGSKTTGAKTTSAKSAGVMDTWTVLNIQPAGKGSDYIKVTFTTSNKVYKLSPKANAAYAKRLKESMDKKTPVYIKRSSDESDMIQSVIVPGVPGQKKKKK